MNFNFVSIPRCASQTIHAAFGTEKFMNHKAISLFPDQTLFSFAVIRDPVEHVRSWYQWHKTKYPLQSKRGDMRIYQTPFEDWCRKGFKTHWTEEEFKIHGLTHCLYQWDYVAIEDEVKVNYLVDFARLDEGLKTVADRLKIKLPKMKRTSVSAEIPISGDARNYIKERFPKDFILYEKVSNGKGD